MLGSWMGVFTSSFSVLSGSYDEAYTKSCKGETDEGYSSKISSFVFGCRGHDRRKSGHGPLSFPKSFRVRVIVVVLGHGRRCLG